MKIRQLGILIASIALISICVAWQTPVIGPNGNSGGVTAGCKGGFCAFFSPLNTMSFSPTFDTSSYLNFGKSAFLNFTVNGTTLNTNSASPGYDSTLTPDPGYTNCPPVTVGSKFAIECPTPSTPSSLTAAWGAGFVDQTMPNGSGGSTKFTFMADLWTSQGADSASSANATQPNLVSSISGSSSGSPAGWNGNANFWGAGLPIVKTLTAFSAAGDLTAARIWIGLCHGCSTGALNADNVALNMAMIRYSTVAGDTVYQCVTDDGTTQTVTPITGATPGTAPVTMEIDYNNANVVCKVGANSATNTTHLPGQANTYAFWQSNLTQAASQTHILTGGQYGFYQARNN